MSKVTYHQAMAVLEDIRRVYANYIDDSLDYKPTLYDYEHEGLSKGSWSIAWESGAPYDWTIGFCNQVTYNDVFIEPINNCILGVYPL